MSDFVTPWTEAHQAFLSFFISQSLLKLTSIELVMPSNHLVLCHPFLLLPSIFPSIGFFSNELALCIRWPKYGSFSFRISHFNEYSGFISFRIDCFESPCHPKDARSLLQHHSSKASALQLLASFMVWLSHPYMTTGKNHNFDYTDLCWQVMSLLLNMLSAAAAAKSLQSCPTLCDPIDSSPPGSLIPGILQAKTLEWVAISFSRGSCQHRNWTCVSCIGRFWVLFHWATREHNFSRS